VVGRSGRRDGGPGEAGSVSVEAVILLPVFLACLFVIMEASLWIYAGAVAQAAAEDGVRVATGADAQSAAAGLAMAADILDARASAGHDWTVEAQPGTGQLTIVVHGTAASVIPGVHFHVTGSATLPWET